MDSVEDMSPVDHPITEFSGPCAQAQRGPARRERPRT
jgi:hypothetical protein